LVLGLLLALMQMVQYRFLFIQRADSLYTGVVATVCAAVGIWAGMRLTQKAAPPPQPTPVPDTAQHSLSQRELEVLQHMARGLSNQEIADTMFVSLNTVKTHVSNIFSKLGVQRRTQAIQKAQNDGIL
jgi:two-component system, NarL family, response regulator LiaR